MTRRIAAAFGSVLLCFALPSSPAGNTHPLDPLSWQEQWAVLEVLLDAGKLDEETTFNRIALRPPAKESVWAYKPGMSVSRQAEVYGRQGQRVFEAVVDLGRRSIAAWRDIDGVQAAWLEEEFQPAMLDELKKRPEFLAALQKRGIKHPMFVDCFAIPVGYLGEEKFAGRRIAMVQCTPVQGVRNDWVRQVEGLIVILDMDNEQILEITDDSAVPVPRTSADLDDATIGPLRELPSPIEIRQALGPGFTLDGHVVSWDHWRFHLRPDARVGTIVSTVTWRDGDGERQVLYEGHLSEIFVPSMDPRVATGTPVPSSTPASTRPAGSPTL